MSIDEMIRQRDRLAALLRQATPGARRTRLQNQHDKLRDEILKRLDAMAGAAA